MLPHIPQFAASDVVSSQPSPGSPSQSLAPELHDATEHVPPAQVLVAFGNAHTSPHEPQLSSVSRRCSQPFATIPSQLAKPGMQETNVHVPLAQVAVAFGNEHAVPQEPQAARVVRLASQPSAGLELQSS
jgi:hypothetical protein